MLHFNQLSGAIPSALGNLTNLTTLRLHSNQLSGAIPSALGNLTNLTILQLSDNQLSGSLPSELGNLTNLSWLWLHSNQLSGSLPSEFGNLSALTRFYLHNNQLSGSIPSELGNLSNLQQLTLYTNQLSGSIPAELGNLSNLQQLTLYTNQLSGSIPAELGNLSNLTYLYLYSNQLSGSIPAELADLSALQRLQLNANQLSGSIPPAFGDASRTPALNRLHLQDNTLTGSVPETLCDRQEAGGLDLDYADNPDLLSCPCRATDPALTDLSDTSGDLSALITDCTTLLRLEGPLRAAGPQLNWSRQTALDTWDGLQLGAGNVAGDPRVTRLDLSGRQLAGRLPARLGDLTSLRHLFLDDNSLSGSIPAALGTLTRLRDLHLDDNQLSGSVPAALGNLTQLRSLQLTRNELSGSIPSSLGDLTQLLSLHLQRNELSGSIPSSLGDLTRLGLLHLQYNTLTRSVPAALCARQTAGELDLNYANNPDLRGCGAADPPPPPQPTRPPSGGANPGNPGNGGGANPGNPGNGGGANPGNPGNGGDGNSSIPGNTDSGGGETDAEEAEVWENPAVATPQSGITVISGWACEAETVAVEFEDSHTGETWTEEAAYGTRRADTAEECGDTDNGFGLLFNWNLLGDGEHTVRLVVDGQVWAERRVRVITLGEEFRRGLSGEYPLPDFPGPGESRLLQWQEAQQNFVIAPLSDSSEAPGDGAQYRPQSARLENPPPASYQSGIGLISGWVCEAETVTVEFTHGTTGETWTEAVAYGTSRLDTQDMCGDTDNGFGLLFNWNLLGDGEHTVHLLVDGSTVAWSTFTVTTLGEEFVRGLSRAADLLDFPEPDTTLTVEWVESQQNFGITGVE